MGGYHWTEIVVEPVLIYPFAVFAVFVPVVSLHFYLVFPRPNPGLRSVTVAAGPGGALRGPGGVPGGALGEHVRGPAGCGSHDGGARSTLALRVVRRLALGYIAAGGGRSSGSASSAWSSATARRATPGRAEPGQVDPAGVAARLGPDRLPALAGLDRPGDPGTRQRGLADVRRLAAVHARLRAEHHPLQADAGRGDHQPERGLLRVQRDGGAALLGGAPGQRHG